MECSFEETVTNQDGSFTSSKCVSRAEVLIINDPCYGLCYVCAYNKLQAENKRLKETLELAYEAYKDKCIGKVYTIKQIARVHRLCRQALQEKP